MKEILEINNLHVRYNTENGVVYALNGINLTLFEGTTMGLVGETGAGKTTLAKAIMGLISNINGRIESGEIIYEGKDLLKLSVGEIRAFRGKQISMIFQDPMTSLNPVMTVGEQIAEAIATHSKLTFSQSMKKAAEMLEMVEIPAERANDYPHQFSGGMKQRVVIAIALACDPAILIADEPTTALDVTIQAQVLELMKELKQKTNKSMLLITHDLGVVAQTCDYVSILYAGEIVESGTIFEVFDEPLHPYTKGLFNSIPKLTEDVHRLSPVEGLMLDPTVMITGCRFFERCKLAQSQCEESHPNMFCVKGEHYVRCFVAGTR